MFIFIISDKKKNFTFNGKKYSTPCKIKVKGIREIDHLNLLLKQNNIKKIKVQSIKHLKIQDRLNKVPISGTTSKVVLSTNIQQTTQARTGTTSIINH